MDRALTERERAVLTALVAAADIPALLVQLPNVRVTGACGCGCPTVYLSVGAMAEAAPTTTRVPVGADVSDTIGDYVLLFTDNGRLSSLEYAWIEQPPREFPGADRLVPHAR